MRRLYYWLFGWIPAVAKKRDYWEQDRRVEALLHRMGKDQALRSALMAEDTDEHNELLESLPFVHINSKT
jgi:hypothetical protein